MNNNDFYQIILLTTFEPCLYNFPCRILYLQVSSMPPPCVTVDSEGDTSLELSSEDSDPDTETN